MKRNAIAERRRDDVRPVGCLTNTLARSPDGSRMQRVNRAHPGRRITSHRSVADGSPGRWDRCGPVDAGATVLVGCRSFELHDCYFRIVMSLFADLSAIVNDISVKFF